MTQRLSCNVATDFQELDQLSAQWHELVLAGGCEIFQHFTWSRTWWESFGKDARLIAPIARRAKHVVGILPLVLEKRCLRMLGYSTCDYSHFLVEPGEAIETFRVCLESLLEYSAHWDEISLDNVPDSSTLAQCVRSLPDPWRSRLSTIEAGRCPTLVLGNQKYAILKSILAKDKLKKTVRYLERRGSLSFRHLDEPREVAIHLGEFFRQHIRRSAVAGRRSGFLDEEYVGFYRQICERFGAGSAIRFSVLEIGDRPVAYHFGTFFNAKYLFYKPTFDVDLWELSPGQALLWYLLEYLQSQNVQELDFGRGEEPYKFRFSNEVRRNVSFSISAPGLRHAVRRLGRSVLGRTKSRVRSSPRLLHGAEALRAQFQNARDSIRRGGFLDTAGAVFRSTVFEREQWMLGSFTPALQEPAHQPSVTQQEMLLSELADIAITFPHVPLSARLEQARKLLREGQTARVVRIDGSERAVLWTLVDSKLCVRASTVTLPKKALIVTDVWMLGAKWSAAEETAVLAHLARIASGTSVSAWALCSSRMFSRRRTLRLAGLCPTHRFISSRMLSGATHWKQQGPE